MALFTTSKPKIFVKSLARFPANVSAEKGVGLTRANGNYTFILDYGSLDTNISMPTPADWSVLVYNANTGVYEQLPLDSLPSSGGGGGGLGSEEHSDTVATFEATAFDASFHVIQILGYYTIGIGGIWVRRATSEPSHPWKFRSADRYMPDETYDAVNGGWWEGFSEDGELNVDAFGADPTGVTDSSPAVQNCVTYSDAYGGVVVFPEGSYQFYSSVVIPSHLTLGAIAIQINAAAIIYLNGAIIGFDRWQDNQTDANNYTDDRVVITGNGQIIGDRTSGQIGIRLAATYGSEISGLKFVSCDIAIKCAFCLKIYIYNIMTTLNVTGGISLESGYNNWTGGNVNNSQSNNSTIFSCRDYARAAADFQYQVLASGGCNLSDIITEGYNPVNSIVFDDQSSTTVKSNIVDNIHSENTPSNALFKFAGAGGGTYSICNVFGQGGGLFLDSSELGVGVFDIYNVPPYGPMLNGINAGTSMVNSGYWNFRNFGNNTTDVFAPAYWTPSVPTNITNDGFQQFAYNSMVFGSTSATRSDYGACPSDFQATARFWSKVATPFLDVTLSNGANQNIDDPKAAAIRIIGPTGGFGIGGIALDQFHYDGQILRIYNSTSQQMTIYNEDGASSAVYRINTLTGADVVLRAGTSFATLVYCKTETRWILASTN